MPMCAQHENMVIDVDSASQSNGAALQLWTWDGVSPQMKWYLEKASDVAVRDGKEFVERDKRLSGVFYEDKIAFYYNIPVDYGMNLYYDNYVASSNSKTFLKDAHLWYIITDRSTTFNPYHGYFASMSISRFELSNNGATTTYYYNNTWEDNDFMYGSNQIGSSKRKALNVTKYGSSSLKGVLILDISPDPLNYHVLSPTFTIN